MTESEFIKAFGERVRQLRQQRELTLDAVGGRGGMSTVHLGRVERGETTASLGIVFRLAAVYGVRIPEMFEF